jgi:enoyl-CoA hydratase/carnithine racemase
MLENAGDGAPVSFLATPERFERTRFDVDQEGIGTLTLTRPRKLNVVDRNMIAEIRSLLWQVAFDDAVKALIITGEGRGFCAGRDIEELRWERALPSPQYRAYVRANHEMLDDLEQLEKPVIAAINGVCAGGGVELAVSCDLRVAADTATFLLPEINLGVIPASGACSRMIQMIGIGRVKEMVLTGATYDAAQAQQWGLVNIVTREVELLGRARRLGIDCTRGAPEAVGLAKSVINTCQDVDTSTGRRVERLAQSKLVTTGDASEGLSAVLSKRPPGFGDGSGERGG